MSLVSALPSVGRRSLEESTTAPYVCPSSIHQPEEQDEDVESTAPSSPCSVYSEADGAEEKTATAVDQLVDSGPHLCSTSPFAIYPYLTVTTVTELRITDNSHSQSNPAQRKKGGCKAVTLTFHTPATTLAAHTIAGKCDVRKSFSNRSFSKYYDRGQYAVIPLTPQHDTVVVVEEAKRGRDGKHFVAMERSCVAPWLVDDKRRHPLLAFAADAVYRVSVLTRPGAGEVEVEVKCQFAQGSVTVSKKKVGASATESKKRQREVKAEAEAEADDNQDVEESDELPAEDAGKRRRRGTAPAGSLERFDSFDSFDFTELASDGISSPASPFSTTDSLSSSSPSYPSSPFTSSTASPSPPSSPYQSPFTFHLNPPSHYQLVDDLELKPLSSAAAAAAPLDVSLSAGGLFMPSPLLAPQPVWPSSARLFSPCLGFAPSPWRGPVWLGEVDEFVL